MSSRAGQSAGRVRCACGSSPDATRTRRLAPLLIVTPLASGGASLSSTAFAAPTTTTANVTTDTDTDSPRTVKHVTKGTWIDGGSGGLVGGGGGSAGDAYTTERENVLWSTDREMSEVHNEL